jgi:hypothetical protein
MNFLKKVESRFECRAERMPEGCELPGTNLLFYGFGRDANGNSVAKFSFPNQRVFSIQTNGNMPKSHGLRGTKLNDLIEQNLDAIKKEAVSYIQKYCPKRQKESLRIY